MREPRRLRDRLQHPGLVVREQHRDHRGPLADRLLERVEADDAATVAGDHGHPHSLRAERLGGA